MFTIDCCCCCCCCCCCPLPLVEPTAVCPSVLIGQPSAGSHEEKMTHHTCFLIVLDNNRTDHFGSHRITEHSSPMICPTYITGALSVDMVSACSCSCGYNLSESEFVFPPGSGTIFLAQKNQEETGVWHSSERETHSLDILVVGVTWR
ncbi:hypothetical protein LZ30DRAFT_692979 [Colletotrichum cereale]|nr:hypothetical protein LZ30DRAFT_692979 [Colletotrichum cereale]